MTSIDDIKEYLVAYDEFIRAMREKELKRMKERPDEYGNKRPMHPWKVYSLKDLTEWMIIEINELLDALKERDYNAIEDELLDVGNFCRFVWCTIHLENKGFSNELALPGKIISERHDNHLDDYPIEFGEAAEAIPMKIGKIQCSRCGSSQWFALLIGSGELQLRCKLCGEKEPSVIVEIKSMKATSVHFEELSKQVGEEDEQDNPEAES